MRHYFQLQARLLGRQLRDFGIHPALALLLGSLVFVGLSVIIFRKGEFAEYAYLMAALSFVVSLSERRRNEFLRGCYPLVTYRCIRLAENGAVALPFLLFQLASGRGWEAAVLGAMAVAFVFFKFGWGGSFTIPTPFGKRPFEFLVGFRKTFYLHLFAYFLAIMAIVATNFNLGIFSLLLVFMVCMAYYSEMEMSYYVWVHTQQPRDFLANKIKTAIIHASILTLPLVTLLAIFFSANTPIILALYGLGLLYLTTMILAKYAAYPHGIGLPQSLLLAFSFSLPPLLFFAIPYFYKNSVKRLNLVLK